MPLLNLEVCPKINTCIHVHLKQYVSTTPLKQFNRISRNHIVQVDILCTCAYRYIFIGIFSENTLILLGKNVLFYANYVKLV